MSAPTVFRPTTAEDEEALWLRHPKTVCASCKTSDPTLDPRSYSDPQAWGMCVDCAREAGFEIGPQRKHPKAGGGESYGSKKARKDKTPKKTRMAAYEARQGRT